MSEYEHRFGGIARLYGTDGVQKIRSAHICVIGIGGVGLLWRMLPALPTDADQRSGKFQTGYLGWW